MMARMLIISDRLSAYHAIQRSLHNDQSPEVWLVDARDLRFFSHDVYAQQPEIVLLDYSASMIECLAASVRVRALFPESKLAVRAVSSWENFGQLAMLAGAHGVIDSSLDESSDDLLLLLDSILAGNLVYRKDSHI